MKAPVDNVSVTYSRDAAGIAQARADHAEASTLLARVETEGLTDEQILAAAIGLKRYLTRCPVSLRAMLDIIITASAGI